MAKIIFFGDGNIALQENTVTAFELFRKHFLQHTILNSIVADDTTETGRAHFAADVLKAKPDAVILSFGLNDSSFEKKTPRVSLASYVENLRFFFREVKKQGAVALFLAPPPVILTEEVALHHDNVLLDQYTAAAEKCAAEEGAEFIPVNRIFRERELSLYGGLIVLSPDGMHPGTLGQELIFRALCETLSKFPGFFPGKALHSFKPGELWPDEYGIHINAHGGGLLKYQNLWYWYGEHKIEGRAGNLAHVGVHVYCSEDLYNWHDCGIAFDIRTCPRMMAGINIIERPKVLFCQATGKFVMWFHFENRIPYTAAEVGVAVADKPEGPFILQNHFRPCQGGVPLNPPEADEIPQPDEPDHLREGALMGQQSRDMTLFQDDDGKAYLFHSSEHNWTMHVVELTPDYLSCSKNFWRVFPRRHMEAPAIFKKDGLYYFIASGCSGWAPNAARSAVAPHPWGPWKELGNPAVDEGAEITYDSQSTFAIEHNGRYILLADRWRPENAIDGRYLWLPIEFEDGRPVIHQPKKWSL